jgi:hypothetical protein
MVSYMRSNYVLLVRGVPGSNIPCRMDIYGICKPAHYSVCIALMLLPVLALVTTQWAIVMVLVLLSGS